jgi:hypothetical protein
MTTSDQSQAAPTSPAPSPEPQDVRQALELQLFDLVELARDTRSDKGGEAKWVHPCGALVKEFAKRIAALAQSDAGPKGIDLDDADRAYDKWAEHRNGQSRLDAFRAGVEFGLRHTAPSRPDVSEHGEIPDCPTDGVAARQGNGG